MTALCFKYELSVFIGQVKESSAIDSVNLSEKTLKILQKEY